MKKLFKFIKIIFDEYLTKSCYLMNDDDKSFGSKALFPEKKKKKKLAD